MKFPLSKLKLLFAGKGESCSAAKTGKSNRRVRETKRPYSLIKAKKG